MQRTVVLALDQDLTINNNPSEVNTRVYIQIMHVGTTHAWHIESHGMKQEHCCMENSPGWGFFGLANVDKRGILLQSVGIMVFLSFPIEVARVHSVL